MYAFTVCITDQDLLCYVSFLQKELERLLKAIEDENISDLHYLIETKKHDVDTCGPSGRPVC